MTTGAASTRRAFVRVLGIKRDRFVEFSFALDDPSLSVDLVMPRAEFAEFCARYQVVTLEGEAHEPRLEDMFSKEVHS